MLMSMRTYNLQSAGAAAILIVVEDDVDEQIV